MCHMSRAMTLVVARVWTHVTCVARACKHPHTDSCCCAGHTDANGAGSCRATSQDDKQVHSRLS